MDLLGMVVDALAAAMDLLGLARDSAVVAREPSGSIGDPSSQGYLAHGGGSPGVGDLLRVPLWAATPTSGQERPGGIMPSVKLPPPQKNRPHLGECQIYFSIIQRKVLTPNDFANVDAIRLRLALYEQLSNRTPKPFAWKFTRQDLLNWLKRAAPHFLAASAVKRRRPGLLRRYLRNGPLSENAQKARRDICGEDGKQWADKLLHTFKHDGYEPTWQQLLEWHVGLRRGQRPAASGGSAHELRQRATGH